MVIRDTNTSREMTIPYASMRYWLSYQVKDIDCFPDLRGANDDEQEFVDDSRLMEPGSGIYLDRDGKVDEGASQ